MKGSAAVSRVKVSADGQGVVSHAGVGMLREVADLSGLSAQVTAALADTYRGPWIHAPGDVFADLAAAVADGADCVDGVGQLLGDREQVFGPVASTTTLWRCVDERIDAAHLPAIRAARSHARARAWAAGAAPDHDGWLHLDVDATITIDHSDNKENAAATWKHTFGFHPLLVFLDRTDIAAGEALAGLLRAGNAGSNTTADHITVLGQALQALPATYRPDPDNPDGPAGVDPLGLRGRHLWVRRGVPRRARGVLAGLCDQRRRARCRRGTHRRRRLVSGDRVRRRHPRRRLGRLRPPPWWTCRPGRPAPG